MAVSKIKIKNPTEKSSVMVEPAPIEFEKDEDEIGRRTVEEDGEVTFTFKSYNPHGFWKIIPSKGPVPEELSGAYTTVKAAELDIIKWRNKQEEKKSHA